MDGTEPAASPLLAEGARIFTSKADPERAVTMPEKLSFGARVADIGRRSEQAPAWRVSATIARRRCIVCSMDREGARVLLHAARVLSVAAAGTAHDDRLTSHKP